MTVEIVCLVTTVCYTYVHGLMMCYNWLKYPSNELFLFLFFFKE